MDLYEYLKTQITDLESAKRWACTWFQEWQQVLPPPFHPENDCYSMRAMASHLSTVLENKTTDDTSSALCTNYMRTKFGSELYSAMMDQPWWKENPNQQHPKPVKPL